MDRRMNNREEIGFWMKDIVMFKRKRTDIKKGTWITRRAHGIPEETQLEACRINAEVINLSLGEDSTDE